MKLIIAGSRTVHASVEELCALLGHFNLMPTEIVSGTAKGIDQCGEALARAVGLPIKSFPADWDRYGKSAGHKRNAQMAEYADCLLLIWDGQSRGSAGMKAVMEKMGKIVFSVIPKEHQEVDFGPPPSWDPDDDIPF